MTPHEPSRRYEAALDKAWLDLEKLSLESICRATGSSRVGRVLHVPYVAWTLEVRPDERRIISPEGADLSQSEEILVLHYLVHSLQTPPRTSLIGLNDIPEARTYLGPFRGRVVYPLLKTFAADSEGLVEAARCLGGEPASLADFSVTIKAFPRVAVILAVWRGDDEIPSEGQVLFFEDIVEHLPLEDIIVLCETLVRRLRRHRQPRREGA